MRTRPLMTLRLTTAPTQDIGAGPRGTRDAGGGARLRLLYIRAVDLSRRMAARIGPVLEHMGMAVDDHDTLVLDKLVKVAPGLIR